MNQSLLPLIFVRHLCSPWVQVIHKLSDNTEMMSGKLEVMFVQVEILGSPG